MKLNKILHPDSKGRICLGKYASGISGYKAIINDKTQEITLKPYTEIPLSENWLYKNKNALNSVVRGISESKNRKLIQKKGFSLYIEE